MLQLEIYKILKRKLVWVIILGIFLYALYWFDEIRYYKESKTLQYQLEQYETAKGILTDEKLENFIKNYQPAEHDYIENFMNEDGKAKKVAELFPNIDFDLHFGYFAEWGYRLSLLEEFMKYIFVFVIVTFSVTFTYEKECGMQEILLTAKNGRDKCRKTKVAAAFFITNLLYLLVLILILLPLFIITKGAGWDTSIQMIIWQTNSTLNINNLELLFHAIYMSFVAINVILLITLSASFLSESPVAALGISLGILLLLRTDIMAVHVNNDIVNLIIALTPLNVIEVMNLTDQAIEIGGIKIQSLMAAEIAYTLLLVIGGAIFFGAIMKREKYYAS